jgi:hypothetical protein
VKTRQWRAEPAAASLLLFSGIVLAGFAAIVLGWRIAARTLNVAFQVPALVSGGLGGLGLVMLGCGLINVQAARRRAAVARAEMEAVLDEASALVESYRRRS